MYKMYNTDSLQSMVNENEKLKMFRSLARRLRGQKRIKPIAVAERHRRVEQHYKCFNLYSYPQIATDLGISFGSEQKIKVSANYAI